MELKQSFKELDDLLADTARNSRAKYAETVAFDAFESVSLTMIVGEC